jgi:hypothetical protein
MLQLADAGEQSPEERFLAFHEANPHVYIRLREMAFELLEHGVRRWGIKALWEALRYENALRTFGRSEYKLNNNYPSRYARMLMERNFDLDGFFEVRERRNGEAETTETQGMLF